MKKTVRYRVYGVIDEGTEGIENLLDEMRQYGSACVVDTEVVESEGEPQVPDAEDDFQQRYQAT